MDFLLLSIDQLRFQISSYLQVIYLLHILILFELYCLQIQLEIILWQRESTLLAVWSRLSSFSIWFSRPIWASNCNAVVIAAQLASLPLISVYVLLKSKFLNFFGVLLFFLSVLIFNHACWPSSHEHSIVLSRSRFNTIRQLQSSFRISLLPYLGHSTDRSRTLLSQSLELCQSFPITQGIQWPMFCNFLLLSQFLSFLMWKGKHFLLMK